MMKSRFTLASVSIVSLAFLLVVFGQAIAYYAVSAGLLASGFKLDLIGVIGLLQNMPYFGLLPQVLGILTLAYFAYTRRFRLDASRSKRQAKTFATILMLSGLAFVSMLGTIPVVKANAIATTNYFLETPLPIADYYIGQYTNSSYFAINGTNWDNFIVSTNASAVAQNCLGNMTSGGKLVFGSGTYTDFSVIITGDGINDWDDMGDVWEICGMGATNTNFTGTTSDVWTVKNNALVYFHDFSINLPRLSTSGDGIVGDDQGVTTNYTGVPFQAGSVIERVRIFGGSSGKWCINIENPDLIEFSDLWLQGTGAGGMRLYQTSTQYNFGDCTFSGNNYFKPNADNGIGLLFDASAGAVSGGRKINIMHGLGQMIFLGQDIYTNITGLYGKYLATSEFYSIHFEQLTRGIYLDNVAYCIFTGGNAYSYPQDGADCVELTANAYANEFRDFYIPLGANGDVFTDAWSDPRYPNIFEGWTIVPQSGINAGNDITRGTVVRDMLLLDSAGGTFTGFDYIGNGFVALEKYGTDLLPYGGNWHVENNTAYTGRLAPMTAYWTGGTMVSVTLGGQSIAMVGTVTVPVGKTITFVWSSEPTFTWFSNGCS